MIITAIKMVIKAEAGWAIGATDTGDAALDRELLVDPTGNPWVPASSLADSLRAHLATGGDDERLMGSRPANGGPADERLTPSRLWLVGTRVSVDEGTTRAPATEVVAATAVDPRRGAARATSLRHSRVVDQPAVVELYAQYEGALTDRDRALLGSWRPQIGRDRTTGGGRAQLDRIHYRTYDLNRDTDLRTWLTACGPDRFAHFNAEIQVTSRAERTVLSVVFEIVDALHIGTGSRQDGIAVVRTRQGRPCIPASSWKGLFRSRSGYILRTVFGEDAACLDQTGCGSCPLCELFGSSSRRGALAFTDSVVKSAGQPVSRTHVAIDRISGGARDKLLFTQQLVGSGKATLTIHELRKIQPWQRSLLLHVVRDLDDGLIGVGGGAQRGQGTLRLTAKSRKVLGDVTPVADFPLPAGDAS